MSGPDPTTLTGFDVSISVTKTNRVFNSWLRGTCLAQLSFSTRISSHTDETGGVSGGEERPLKGTGGGRGQDDGTQTPLHPRLEIQFRCPSLKKLQTIEMT